MSAKRHSLLFLFGVLLGINLGSLVMSILGGLTDIPAIVASVGYLMIVGSTFPQIWVTFNSKDSGNMPLSFPTVLTLGIGLLLPSVAVSGRWDLILGTIANVTSAFFLWLGCFKYGKWRKPKEPDWLNSGLEPCASVHPGQTCEDWVNSGRGDD